LPALTAADLDEIYHRIAPRHVTTIHRLYATACGWALRGGRPVPTELAFMAALLFQRPRDEDDPCDLVVTLMRDDSPTRKRARKAFIDIKSEQIEVRIAARGGHNPAPPTPPPSDNPGHHSPPAFDLAAPWPALPRYEATEGFPQATATHRDACIRAIAKLAGGQTGRGQLRAVGRHWLRTIIERDCPVEPIVMQFADPKYDALRRKLGRPKTRE
jgi:hypothetical protein